MTSFALVLALAAVQDLPSRMALAEPARQDLEQEPQRPKTEIREGEPAMEYVYRNSRLEAGMLWTSFDSDLSIEGDFAWYVRWGVGVTENLEVNVTFRQYDFYNSDLPALGSEGLLIRGLLLGVGFRLPIATGFEFSANTAAGAMRWESQDVGFDDATGPILSGEAGLSVRLTAFLRLRVGVALDAAASDFHAPSTETSLSFSTLIGFEIGVR